MESPSTSAPCPRGSTPIRVPALSERREDVPELIQARYGRGPDKSYFVGCSGGGRQGMMFSQRFPGYFDGIVSIAPAMRSL